MEPVPKEWKNETADNYDLYYPDAVTSRGSTNLANGTPWNDKIQESMKVTIVENYRKEEKRNPKTTKYPLRKDLLPLNIRSTVFTNHFLFKATGKFYKFEILGLDSDARPRRRIKDLFSKAIDTWGFLNDNRESFASDGLKTLVAWKDLRKDIGQDIPSSSSTAADGRPVTVWLPEGVPDGTRTVPARFSFLGELDIAAMTRQSNADLGAEIQETNDVARCLNILVSKSLGLKVHQSTSSKFFVRTARFALRSNIDKSVSRSLELIRGYSYTVKIGMGNLLLNFNLATSTFFRPILVSDFFNDNRTFVGEDRRRDILVGKRVYIIHTRGSPGDELYQKLNKPASRIKTITEFGKAIKDLSFRKRKIGPDGKFLKDANDSYIEEPEETLVADYLEEVFGQSINRELPAVNVGSRLNPVWYAQEHLRIVPYQIYARPVPEHLATSMVDEAARGPAQSRRLIEHEGLSCLGLVSDGKEVHLRACSEVSIVPTMLTIPADCVQFPQVLYKIKSGSVHVDHQCKLASNWKVYPDLRFQKTSTVNALNVYIVLDADGSAAKECFDELQRQLVKCGLHSNNVVLAKKPSKTLSGWTKPKDDEPDKLIRMTEHEALIESLKEAKSNNVDLVLLIMSKPSLPRYTAFKRLADREHGLQSICITTKFAGDKGKLEGYMTNIAMKVNIKRGGINQRIEGLDLKGTMVLGADVIHPGPGSLPHCPSIAAMVGSVDDWGCKCLGSMRLQQRDRADREIIDDVEGMVLERLLDYYNEGGRKSLPKQIIYYRDGVSEGQYDKVRDDEVQQIRNAFTAAENICKKSGDLVKISAVIGVKRHHVRFYPTQKNDEDKWGGGNCKPGTFVDRAVTSPYYRDFYLQSHSGIKGTARPTHYFVVLDEIFGSKSLAELRTLTHRLCYNYQRANVPVSYATPTYYADRLCERGRLYLRDFFVASADHTEALQNLKFNAEAVRRRQREQRYGGIRNQDGSLRQKTDSERQQIRTDQDAVENLIRQETLRRANNVLNVNRYSKQNWRSPWPKEFGKVMFWL